MSIINRILLTELQYMGNTIFIQDKRVCTKSLRSWLEAIQRLQPPTTIKWYRSFTGMVNILGMFCLGLQKMIKTYIWFSKKRKTIHMVRRATDNIWRHKCRLIRLPVLQ